jgi:hypothetical protein
LPGGLGSPECSIVFGNHNAHTKNICWNKSGILRCPTVGLLYIERSDCGDWVWTVVGGFIGVCFEVLSLHLTIGSVKCFHPWPIFGPEPPDYKTGELIAAV